jgi:hypothetical protein
MKVENELNYSEISIFVNNLDRQKCHKLWNHDTTETILL